MPPRLVQGKAAGQRRINVPNSLEWCTCSECLSSDYVDISVNAGLRGRYVTRRQRLDHIKEDNRKALAIQHLATMSLPSQNSRRNAAGQNSQSVPSPAVVNIEVASLEEHASETDSDMDTDTDADSDTDTDTHSESESQTDKPTSRRERRREKYLSAFKLPMQPRMSSRSRKLQHIIQSLGVISSPVFLKTLETDPLVFKFNPAQYLSTAEALLNPEVYELNSLHPSNYAFLNLETSLYDSERYLEQKENWHPNSPGYTPRVQKALSLVREQQARATQTRQDCWNKQREIFVTEKKRLIDSEKYLSWSLRSMEPISCLIYLLSATLHFVADLSINDLGFVLPCLSMLITMALHDSPNLESNGIIKSIPSDVRTVISSIGIDPQYHSMVCCPSCFQTYKFDRENSLSYPELCTYRSVARGPMCGRRLQNPVGDTRLPKQEYVYQDLPHWIARMYARPDIEEYLDTAPIGDKNVDGSKLNDMWDGSVLRNFQGPDGQHFMSKPENEGRLIFGLNMDGFNPYGNKEAGKHVTICGIYLVCLNLPPEIRYKPENIFLLGVVPGPDEPSTHEVNHVLRPLVDDLLFLWYTGIYLSRTPRYLLGRPVRCALVPIICDLPAARRVAGLAGHGAGTFCSECLLQLRDINELDQSKWTPRSYAEHYAHATRWRDAASETQRTDIFHEYGAKWSELLRLPYWDPTMFVVIDPMHGFYLRMFHRHIREIWGMNVELEDGDGVPNINVSEEEILKAQEVLRHGSVAELQALKRGQMQYLCRDTGEHYGGRKGVMCKVLIKHRIAQGWFHENGEPIVMAQPMKRFVASTTPSAAPKSAQTSSVHPTPLPASSTFQSPQTTSTTSGPGVPSVLPQDAQPLASLPTSSNLPAHPPPVDDASPDQLLDLYENYSKTALSRVDIVILVALCALKLGGTHADYVGLSKKTLVTKIQQKRVEDGTVGITGRVHRKKGFVPPLTGHFVVPNQAIPAGNKAVPDANIDISEKTREDLLHIYQTGSKSKVKSIRKPMLTVLCAIKFRGGRPESIHEYLALTKARLLELLEESRLADGIINEDGTLVDDHSNRDNAVLGQAMLKAIRDDMETIQLPSWFNRAPKHPGEVKWGKFKAAEWRSFCTVNLPITLTRLWGSKPKDTAHYLMLENFMHLVTAVKIASNRTITFDDIDRYESHMKTYISGLLKLYPHMSLTPYQHLALHFPAHLRRFGPTHSWRCFAFERYNGLIQKLPTNNRFGEIEKSKFLRFCRVQNVRALYSEGRLPAKLHPVVKLFELRYELTIPGILQSSGVRTKAIGTSNNSLLLGDKHVLCFEDWMVLTDPKGKNRFIPSNHTVFSYVSRFGQRYEAGPGANSNVIFQKYNRSEAAGQITLLFSYTRLKDGEQTTEIFAILHEYRALSQDDRRHDILQHLPLAVGFQVYDNFCEDLTLVPFANIRTHFAAQILNVTGMASPTIQVIPLSL